MTRGDNSGKTRNMRQLFFHEESIHEVSRRYLEHEYIHTYIHTYVHTYGQAETNMPPHFFKVGGIIIYQVYCAYLCRVLQPGRVNLSQVCQTSLFRVSKVNEMHHTTILAFTGHTSPVPLLVQTELNTIELIYTYTGDVWLAAAVFLFI